MTRAVMPSAARISAARRHSCSVTPAPTSVTSGRIVVAEDHHPEGGLGSAVADALLAAGQRDLQLTRLAVSGMPGSGSGAELLAWAGIDADHIAAAARQLVRGH